MNVTMVGLSAVLLALVASTAEPVAVVRDRPLVLAETQFYPVREQHGGFLGRYVDLPLLFDYGTSRETMYENGRFSQADFEAYQREAKAYGLDGFSYFPASRPSAGLAASRSPLKGFATVPILGLRCGVAAEREEENIRQALANPDSVRIGGKIVLLSYWDFDAPDPACVAKRIGELRTKFGDSFVYFQSVARIAHFRYRASFRDKGRIDPEQIAEMKEYLRGYLRVSDGLQTDEGLQMTRIENDVRVFDEAYFAAILKIMRETMAEPEFGGKKLLAVNVMNGHENAYTRGYTLSHDGTRTLRKMLKCAMDAKADVINLFEWDEWNENTSFLPTLCNSFATKRIIRNFTDNLRGLGARPFEGDDTSLPCLVLSYRKSIAPGEVFFVEVLNVPDGVWKGRLTVTISLSDENGKMVRAFSEKVLDAEKLEDVRFSLLLDGAVARALSVKLAWKAEDGRSGEITAGLPPVNVAPAESWSVKTFRQPIRDLAKVPECAFAFKGEHLEAKIRCDEPIKYAMVSENGIVEYIHGQAGKESRFRETDASAVFAISGVKWQSCHRSSGQEWTLRVAGIPEAEWLMGPFSAIQTNETAHFGSLSVFSAPMYLRVPKAKLDGLKLEIDVPEIFQGEIPLDVAFAKGAYGIGGKDGVEFSVARFNRQAFFPPPLGEKKCAFTIRPDKTRLSSIYDLTVVTESGKLWRSRPVVDEESPAARYPDLKWDFSPVAGDALIPLSGERRFFGMAGAEHSPINLINRGPATMGAIDNRKTGKAGSDTHPRRERLEHGEWALVFDGEDDYAGFPHETLPQFGAYTLSLDVFPERDGQQEVFAGAYGEGGGSLAFVTRNEHGRLVLDFMGLRFEHTRFNTGLELPSGRWTNVVISNDVHSLTAVVDGKVARRACCHPGRHPTVFSIGGVSAKPFFKGKIKNLAVKHRPADRGLPVPESVVLKPRLLSMTPEARSLLAELAESGKVYRPVSGRTHVFVRTQLKYGLQRTDFLHNWYERPLYQDSTYAMENQKGKWLNLASWRKQVEIGKLSKLDGFAFFPLTRGRDEAYVASIMPGGEFTILPEMSGGVLKGETGVEFCERAVAAPNAFRINGRVVITQYPEMGVEKMAFHRTLKVKLGEKGFAEKVALAPYSYIYSHHVPFQEYCADRLDAELLNMARERIREVLRHVDGFVFSLNECKSDRRFNKEVADKLLIPLVHSVMSEPEFRGKKLLGVVFSQGHENSYRWKGIYDSNGTQGCRDELETIEKLRPDFVIGCEWDEQDENTHFRPTVSNGHVTQRLLRYYIDRMNGREPEIFPGDDPAVPNLVLSYRKTLQAGELLETEVVNIPDGTAPAAQWRVTLRWKTPDGRIVKEYETAELDATTCSALRFATPVSELVQDQLLVPELVVEANGVVQTFADGFWPLDLAANRNYDYKWVRGALREIPQGVTGSLAVGPERADGTVEVRGEVKGPVKFRSVEVLEGPDTIYMHSAPAAAPDEICLRISMQGMEGSAERNRLVGSIRVVNAEKLRCTPVVQGRVQQKGDGWVLRGMPLGSRFTVSGPWERTFFATFFAASVDAAEVVVDLPPVFQERIKVKDLLARNGIGVAGPSGAYLWVGRFFAPMSQPAPLGENEAQFTFAMRPADPNGVLRLQAVDENFRIWRGAAHSFFTPSGKKTVFHVFERASETVSEVEIDSNRIVALDYDFSGKDGNICWSGKHRLLPFVPGASILSPVGIGAADGGGQTSPVRGSAFIKDPACTNAAPRFADEPEGFRSLVFGGTAFAGMGLQVLPPFAGFELELKIKPEDIAGRQGLVGTGNLGFELWLEDGMPHVYLNRGSLQRRGRRNSAEGAYFTGPKLEPGKWQVLRFVTDQREAYLEVNGVCGETQHFGDWRYNPCVAGVGKLATSGLGDASSSGFFRGRLASFKVSPR